MNVAEDRPSAVPVPHERIVRELRPDESVVWAGQPRQGWRVYVSDILLVPWSLVIAWLLSGFARDLRDAQRQWDFSGVVLVTLGLAFFVLAARAVHQRFAWDRRRRRQTFYALTDQRAIMLFDGATPRVRCVELATVRDVSSSFGSGGSGTISFGSWFPEPASVYREGRWELERPIVRRWWSARLRPAPAFEQIAPVRDVYALVRLHMGEGGRAPAKRHGS